MHKIQRATLFLLVTAAVTLASAATTRPGKAVSLLAEQTESLESQIAQRNMRRADLGADALTRHEAYTDLLVIAHHLAERGLLSKPASDAQVMTYLRSLQLVEAAAAVDQLLVRQPDGTLSAQQKEALRALHQITFNLELKSTADVDMLCQTIGGQVLKIGAPQPVDLRTLPRMRPTTRESGSATREGAEAPPPIAQLVATVQTAAAISIPLRGQLLALARAAADPAEPEASAMHRTLAEMVALTKSLENHVAVTPEKRQQIETQLAESLALYGDRRTRSTGQKRIEALSAAGQALARIDRLKLTSQQKTEIAPSLIWMNESESGAAALDFLERYAQSLADYEAARKAPLSLASLRKPSDELAKQFEQHRKDFWTALADLPKRGDLGIDTLRLSIDEMDRLKDLFASFLKLPAALDTLTTFRPRPGGGLEKRIQALAANAVGKSDPRSAARQIDLFITLSKVAGELSKLQLKDLPPAIVKDYAGDALGGVEQKWRSAVTDAASVVAGGNDLDRARIARLDNLHRCLASLVESAAVEHALTQLEGVRGWVDWTADPTAARALLEPYRLATVLAVGSLGTDNGDGLDQWLKTHQRYAPLSTLYRRAAEQTAACANLPAGLAGVAAKLRTPLDQQPFGPERYASFVINQWKTWSALESPEADALVQPLCKRLAKDFGLPFDEPKVPRKSGP